MHATLSENERSELTHTLIDVAGRLYALQRLETTWRGAEPFFAEEVGRAAADLERLISLDREEGPLVLACQEALRA